MLSQVFQQFSQVRQITFAAKSPANSPTWLMHGTGSVQVRVHGEYIDFDEQITFANGKMAYDQKRWQCSGSLLKFYRFRNGDYEQIFEFEYQNGEFVPQQSYWCDPDDYTAELHIQHQIIVLTIYVHGARKNECLRYEYMAQSPFSEP